MKRLPLKGMASYKKKITFTTTLEEMAFTKRNGFP